MIRLSVLIILNSYQIKIKLCKLFAKHFVRAKHLPFFRRKGKRQVVKVRCCTCKITECKQFQTYDIERSAARALYTMQQK